MKKTLLLLGNGFSLDAVSHLNFGLNPSKPFSLPEYYMGLFNDQIINKLRNDNNTNDFDKIYNLLEIGNELEIQKLRQFIAIEYAGFSREISTQLDMEWRWYKWISKNHRNISSVFCLNYDLIFEICLEKIGINYSYLGVTDPPSGVRIFKPHGSVNLDFPKLIDMPEEQRLNNIVRGNQCRYPNALRVLDYRENEILSPRIQPDLVLPTEESQQKSFYWVEKGYSQIYSFSKKSNSCIIVGISYQSCDEEEINSVLNSLPADCLVIMIVVDTNNIEERQKILIKLIKKKFRYFVCTNPNTFFEEYACVRDYKKLQQSETRIIQNNLIGISTS